MMPWIDYDRPRSLEQLANALHRGGDGTQLLAGGTDLLQLLKDGMSDAGHLLDLRLLASELAGIGVGDDGGLRIGALTPLADVAASPLVSGSFRALAQAAAAAASPQLRNMATIGGNLLQLNRCDYFREGTPCALNGGDTCFAREGDNAHHSIFADDTARDSQARAVCIAVNPSDPATALLALDAEVELLGPRGDTQRRPLAGLLKDPEPGQRRHVDVERGEIITAVVLPAPRAESVFVKSMERAAWSFALASVAAWVRFGDAPGDGAAPPVVAAHIVLGGVAGRPRRASTAEAALIGKPLDNAAITAAAHTATAGSRTLGHNAYKIPLVQGLTRQALRDLQQRAAGPGADAGQRAG